MGDNQAAAKSAGSVNVGGTSFNLSEQATVLLHQAFELMSDSKGAKQQGDEGACAEPKGKGVATIDSGDKVPKSQPAADGAESTRQAAARTAKLRDMLLKSATQVCTVTYVRSWITLG
jgi:hypothetical protein